MRLLRIPLLACVVSAAATCGGGGGNPGGPTPGNSNQMTISAGGVVTPSELVVSPGSRVLFINNHSRPHNITSDQHPAHEDCPEINQVGILAPGQRRETGNLVAVGTCGIHDHDDFDNRNLWARIVIR